MNRIDEFEKNVEVRLRAVAVPPPAVPTPATKTVEPRDQMIVRPPRGAVVPSSSAFLFGMCFGVIAARVACAPFTRLSPG